ncbi:uncharacterized protein LOC124896697 [Capsicum annuum]|uniref:uncharacterized protein LOC124896697 n=1 Tax=Capsicum annuum TaxID=4072 RepID=UPI001FB12362|nr:uncharacterized protein LOC124896697 [Capsicum annuum]
MPSSSIPPSFPKEFLSKGENAKFKKLFDKFSTLSINIPLVEDLQDMPGYAKYLKDLTSKKRILEDKKIEIMHNCSDIISRTLAKKKNDLGIFIISCTIEYFKFVKALFDIVSSINLMPYDRFYKLKLVKPQPTMMKFLIADHSIKKPIEDLYDVLVKVDQLIFPAYIMILDCAMDIKDPIILERPFLAIEKALVDVESDEIKFWLNNEDVSFNIFKSMK